ncbi:thioredoxin domain-containing protein [Corynebacterium sp. 3HC-13]|uniref:DsbA family protein n=1 Tax=Corynebacterium poyangense TaxID=2684405 RepID=UPI001CCD94A6|nr:thioredoxin domain-containing protein [Corynebacterium poyangense]MBZ8178196.1 thioredoxin domain-containing protein [Corynebacterium poyangense]
MSNRVKSPTQGGGAGFIWGILAIVVIAAVVIGYIVVKGRKGDEDLGVDISPPQQVAFTVEHTGDTITLKSDKATDQTKKLELYEDFSCPHCGELSVASDADLRSVVESGEAVLIIHPLHFLDNNNTDGHSHHALAAILAVADSGDATAYWGYHTLLMEHMQQIYNQWDDAKFAAAAEQIGVSSDVASEIKDGKYLQEADDIGQNNKDKLEKDTGTVSSPRIFVNGKEFDLQKHGTLQGWVDAALKS